MRENFSNFGLSALVSPNPLTSSGTSFTVTAGQGALFPSANFCVTIDAEILFILSRSGDTFTISIRGFDNTVAASHAVGAAIQLSFIAYNLLHIWQNVADSYAPWVPPVQQPGSLSASSWDNEFEAAGGWTLYPASAGSGSIWNAGSSLRSHLLLDRGATDNTLYTAYIAFNPPASTPFLVTAKLSMGVSFLQTVNTNNQLQAFLFICDQTNPTSSTTGGNRFIVKALQATNVNTSGASYYANAYAYTYASQIAAAYCSSGTNTSLSPVLTPSQAQTLFLRIAFDGANTYTAYLGDGFVYWPIASKSSLGFTPQSVGIQLANYVASGSGYPGTQAIDYVRVVTGSANPRFGS